MMKLNEVVSGFDAYTRRARIYPGLLVGLPIAAFSATLLKDSMPLAALVPLLLGAGTLFLVSNIVRWRGRRVEQRLVLQWDGMPTTKLLRLRHPQNQVLLDRRRRAVEKLFGSPLPTRRQEAANPQKADETYIAATRCLIAHVRSRSNEFPLVDHENATYGYARNLLGIKPLALAVLAAAMAIDVTIFVRNGISAPLVSVAALHLTLVGVWVFFIRPAWVCQIAETYAERLFETLEQPTNNPAPQADTKSGSSE